MSWESRLEALRERLASHPARTRTEIENELESDADVKRSPSARVRFLSLLVACHREMGDFAAGLATIEEAAALGGSPVARAELYGQAALFHLARGYVDEAIDAVRRSLEITEDELAEPVGSSPYSQRRRRWFESHKAACLVIRGDITLRLNDRPVACAMADALAALAISSHRTALRARMAAITLLTSLLTRFGTLNDVSEALVLLGEADRALARRRVSRKHDHRLRIRWGKALALCRLGFVDRAEEIMVEVIKAFIKAGSATAARNAIASLDWVVGERAGKPERALRHRQRFLSRLPAD